MVKNSGNRVVAIECDELEQLMVGGSPLTLLDVREPDERAFCAIRTPAHVIDLHVPLGQIQAAYAEIARAVASAPLIVYCHLGVRSAVAAKWLQTRGIPQVYNLEGGIDAYARQIDPELRRY